MSWVKAAAHVIGAYFYTAGTAATATTAATAGGLTTAGTLAATAAATAVANKAFAPKIPGMSAQPGVPQLDQAKQQQGQLDRIRMRRGALATIFGGNQNSAPQTAGKSLLGS